MGDGRPSWQIDACPRWCASGHREDDPIEDRVHRSAGIVVPVVSRRTSFEGALRAVAVDGVDLEIGISRADGGGETWFYLGAGPQQYLELSGESAVRLFGAVSVELRRMHGGWG